MLSLRQLDLLVTVCRVRVDGFGPVLPVPTETAIIAAVPEAEQVVGEHRRRFDPAAILGVPAHVTVLAPFVDPTAIDAEVLARLGAIAQSCPAFNCAFGHTGWFARDVLWLAPEPAEPFRHLTAAVWAAFPDHPPYGGAFDDVVPHLTIGRTQAGTLSELELVEHSVERHLPLVAGIESLILIAGTTRPSSWHIVAELPLGARNGSASMMVR